MSIFDMFKTTPAPAPVTTAAPAPTSTVVAPEVAIPAPTVTIDPNNPTAPVLPEAVAIVPNKEAAPLDAFKGIWDTVPLKEGEKAPVAPKVLTVEDVQKVVAKTDFSTVVTPEQLAAIAAGGEEAQVAFGAAMNAVAQNVMVKSTMVGNKLTEKSIQDAVKAHLDTLPQLLRDNTAADHLVTNHPTLNNPAIKPLAEATRARLLEHYPTATPQQITDMTLQFIQEAGKLAAPAVTEAAPTPGETDWEKLFLG